MLNEKEEKMDKVIDISDQKPRVQTELEKLCEKLSISKNTELKKTTLIAAGIVLAMNDKDVYKAKGLL